LFYIFKQSLQESYRVLREVHECLDSTKTMKRVNQFQNILYMYYSIFLYMQYKAI